MSTSRTVSVTLPPEVLDRAEECARKTDMTFSELMNEALRRYLIADEEWESLLRVTRAAGKMAGVRNEQDVERISDEYRREKHA